MNIPELVAVSEKLRFVGLAGPGTGKSTAFRQIVESEHFNGKKVLILSFINMLVDDLRDTFKDHSNVEVATLHSFATKLYKKKSRGEVEIDEKLDKFIGEDYTYLTNITTDFARALQDVNLSKDEENFYNARQLYYGHKSKVLSHNSIIYEVNKLMSKDSMLIPDDYDLILIDEFQDFNQLEYEFINNISKKTKTVVVGDDDQSLYGWKGAKPDLIRALYKEPESEQFTLDHCYRCTRVVVAAANDLIESASKRGLLPDRESSKQFNYPEERTDNKHDISARHTLIDYIPAVSGDMLYYKLSEQIKKDSDGIKNKRILVLAPSYLKHGLYGGLVSRGVNVVEYEIFSEEKNKNFRHRYIIDTYRQLEKRKTDNLSLRKILRFYLTDEATKDVITISVNNSKGLWNILSVDIKSKINFDIALLKKSRNSKASLTKEELHRLSDLLNLNKVITKVVKGFDTHKRGAIEVELTTVMSSKGLSAELVYFVGIDDAIIFDRETKKVTDQTICEVLVAMTRSKEKLTLISLYEENPTILSYIDQQRINRVYVKR